MFGAATFTRAPGQDPYLYYGAIVGHHYNGGQWEKIRVDHIAGTLASNFCYLTGAAGYTRSLRSTTGSARSLRPFAPPLQACA